MRLEVANARIGARRSRLLGRAGLLEILARGSTEARIGLVRESAAGAAIAAPTAGGELLAAAEAGLWRRLAAEAAELLGHVEGSRPRALLAAWLELAEADAVKAVVRGLLGGEPLDEVLAAAPATPGLRAEALRAAVAEAAVGPALEVLAAAGSPAAVAARATWESQERTRHSLLPIEIAADRAALERAFRAARGRSEDARVLRAHLADRVDARNAATLLALGSGAPSEDPFLPRGRRLDPAALLELARSPLEARTAFLSKRLRIPAEDLASPARADLTLERAGLAAARWEARRCPLSLAVPLAYLAERRAEVRRIALALRGAELGLPGEELIPLVEA